MKLQFCGCVALLLSIVCATRADTPSNQTAPVGQAPSVGGAEYTVAQVGPHFRLWRNPAGQSITEVATGMNYWDGQEWTPSRPAFQISPDGTRFSALSIQDPTYLAANLDCLGAVTVTTPDGVTLRSTPIALCLYDPASGQSAIVATVTNCLGALVDDQDVVYEKAFVGGGFAASVIYSLPDTASFHQDFVFTGFDPDFSPTNYGFAAGSANTLQIQIFTEFYDPPQPESIMRPLYVEQDAAKRSSMASPDFIDYTLDFGDYVFGPGRAYVAPANDSAAAEATVAKEFVTANGRTFLIESVPFRALEGSLRALPAPESKTSMSKPKSATGARRFAALSLPCLRSTHATSPGIFIPHKLAAAGLPRPRGVTMDYVATVSSTTKPTVYSSDTTYFVSGSVVDSSTVTIESAVFKYPTNATSSLMLTGPLTLATTNYRPAVFTAGDDNTAGASLNTNIWSGYTGNPSGKYYGNAALWLDTAANIALNNLRFCYARMAIEISADTASQSFALSHSQLVDCISGIYVSGGNGSGSGGSDSLNVSANNCLMANVEYPFQTTGVILSGAARNCTIDSAIDFVEFASGTSGSFGVTNSILSEIASEGSLAAVSLSGGYNGFYSSPAFGSYQTIVSANPYQTAAAGNYYISPSSPLFTNGTTNIGASLLTQLQSLTTQAPLVLTNWFVNNTTLTPYAQRDTAGPMLGYHYNPIDYIAACSVSNATLLLTNGVSVAYYDNLGLWLQDGASLVSQGSPTQRNYLAYYGAVQEQPLNYWGAANALAQSLPICPAPFNSLAAPSISLRLTTLCAPTGQTNLFETSDSGQVISSLNLRDCEIYGSGANWIMTESNHVPAAALVNNVFHRVPFAVNSAARLATFNNLFYGTTNVSVTNTTIALRSRDGISPNTNEDNVFDGVTASLDGAVGYNGYIHGATNTAFQATDLRTYISWLGGPLGNYYQPSNSPFINAGSTSAASLGLYHYTVMTNLLAGCEIKETNSIVDLGVHYVAVDSNGVPISTPGDAIPDYLADANGDGLVESGEISWLAYVSLNGLTPPGGLTVFTPLK